MTRDWTRSKGLSSADHGPWWSSVAMRSGESSPVVSAAPCTTYREGRRIYPSQVLVKTPEGGLDADSVVLGEQVRVLDKKRLVRRRGELTPATIARLN